jgi:mono/diheme cytochrome c family protein
VIAAGAVRAPEKFECFQCHEVQGEGFPAVTREPGSTGPDLTGLGDHHPAEYFAESIVHPNAVILTEPGYTGADGLSIMPDFTDSMTVAELIDAVAFLRSLLDPANGHRQGGHGAPERATPAAPHRH